MGETLEGISGRWFSSFMCRQKTSAPNERAARVWRAANGRPWNCFYCEGAELVSSGEWIDKIYMLLFFLIILTWEVINLWFHSTDSSWNVLVLANQRPVKLIELLLLLLDFQSLSFEGQRCGIGNRGSFATYTQTFFYILFFVRWPSEII